MALLTVMSSNTNCNFLAVPIKLCSLVLHQKVHSVYANRNEFCIRDCLQESLLYPFLFLGGLAWQSSAEFAEAGAGPVSGADGGPETLGVGTLLWRSQININLTKLKCNEFYINIENGCKENSPYLVFFCGALVG